MPFFIPEPIPSELYVHPAYSGHVYPLRNLGCYYDHENALRVPSRLSYSGQVHCPSVGADIGQTARCLGSTLRVVRLAALQSTNHSNSLR